MTINSLNLHFNKFFKKITIKKQHIKKLQEQYFFLANIKQKNYKKVNKQLLINNNILNIDYNSIIMYIIDITFSTSNTFITVMDSSGNPIFFRSAGDLKYKGKTKISRFKIFTRICFILKTKLKYLKRKPIAIHLKNVGSSKFWIVKNLNEIFNIEILKVFNLFPYNGCRNKKIIRKKTRLKYKKKRIRNKKSFL